MQAQQGQRGPPAAAAAQRQKTALLRLQAAATAAAMRDSALAAQVIMAGIDSAGALSEWEKRRLRELPAGAIMLFHKNLNTDAVGVKNLLDDINNCYQDIKPFIAVDHEGGTVQRFAADIPRLPAPLSYQSIVEEQGAAAALLKIEQDAETSAQIIHALGVNFNLAPLAETLTPQNAAFLKTRSYGTDPAFVAAAASAFIRGMNKAGIACAVKHFPGNSAVDPHQKTPELFADALELKKITAPFIDIIQNENPAAIMVSHIIVQSWDPSHIASLSPVAINKKLKTDANFSGIVIADDFSMGAAQENGAAQAPGKKPVEALCAGIDMVMAWPNNYQQIHKAILTALQNGVLPRERLLDAATRIIYQKMLHDT
jgi:beta-N-acetylhexosaminidase